MTTSSIIDQEQIKEYIKDQFSNIELAVSSFKNSFVPGRDSIRACFNFYIPSKDFFNKDGELIEKSYLIKMTEILKDTVLEIIEVDESAICSISIIKRPSNNGENEMFVRLKRVAIGELSGRNIERRLQKSPKREHPTSRKRFETEW